MRKISEGQQSLISDSKVDSTAAQAWALLHWGTGAELAVAGASYGAGRSEAGGG